MKIARFIQKKEVKWGIVEDSSITLLKDAPFKKAQKTAQKIKLGDVRLLAPSAPSKIICVGLNYRDHAKELNMPLPPEPVIFLKPPTSVIGHGGNIVYPKSVDRVDYEAELAVVIGRQAKDISAIEVSGYILGWTCLNDVTARNLQAKDGQWSRAKSFDTFCPVGPWIETDIKDAGDLKIRSYLNGEIKQDSNTAEFIWTVEKLVSFVSGIMTLLPGDIISTGTPCGTGPMKRGDTIEIEIENIGKLSNHIV